MVRLSVCIYLLIYLLIYLFIYLFIHLFNYLFRYASVVCCFCRVYFSRTNECCKRIVDGTIIWRLPFTYSARTVSSFLLPPCLLLTVSVHVQSIHNCLHWSQLFQNNNNNNDDVYSICLKIISHSDPESLRL